MFWAPPGIFWKSRWSAKPELCQLEQNISAQDKKMRRTYGCKSFVVLISCACVHSIRALEVVWKAIWALGLGLGFLITPSQTAFKIWIPNGIGHILHQNFKQTKNFWYIHILWIFLDPLSKNTQNFAQYINLKNHASCFNYQWKHSISGKTLFFTRAFGARITHSGKLVFAFSRLGLEPPKFFWLNFWVAANSGDIRLGCYKTLPQRLKFIPCLCP